MSDRQFRTGIAFLAGFMVGSGAMTVVVVLAVLLK